MALVEAGSECLRTATSEEGGGLGAAGDIQLLKHMGKITAVQISRETGVWTG